MATATIVKVWTDKQGNAHAAAAVDEGGAVGRVEYIGTVDAETWSSLPNTTAKRSALTNAVKAARDAQVAGDTVISGITGSVTL